MPTYPPIHEWLPQLCVYWVCTCAPVCGRQLVACSNSGCMLDLGLFLLYINVCVLPLFQSLSVINAVAHLVRVCMWRHVAETLGRLWPAFVVNCVRVWVCHSGVVYGYTEGSRCMHIHEANSVSGFSTAYTGSLWFQPAHSTVFEEGCSHARHAALHQIAYTQHASRWACSQGCTTARTVHPGSTWCSMLGSIGHLQERYIAPLVLAWCVDTHGVVHHHRAYIGNAVTVSACWRVWLNSSQCSCIHSCAYTWKPYMVYVCTIHTSRFVHAHV